jgi:hypothetical protein
VDGYAGNHESVTVDQADNLVRRLESHTDDHESASDVYVVYEPLLEPVNSAALVEELSVAPW